MPEITVYTSDGWGPCHMVKVYLSRKGISFTEYNVSQEPDARETLLGLGYRATPVTVIGSSLVVGYNTGKIDEALAAAGA